MTPKINNSPFAVWARSIFPKATNTNSHKLDYNHNSFLAQASQQQRLASSVSEQQHHKHYGFYQQNTQAPEDHQRTKEPWYQCITQHPTAKLATVVAGTSAAFWLNHNRNEQMKWKQPIPKELNEVTKHDNIQPKNGSWLEKSQMLGDCVARLSYFLDGTCPRSQVYMMGVMPDKRIPGSHEPLTPPLTPDNSPLGSSAFKPQGKDKKPQNSPLESAIFDFESFINQNLARAENIIGLYYARHAEGLPKNHKPQPHHTPAHFFHLASEKFHPSAQFNLALCYHYGKGGVSEIDLPKALEYYHLAAADGHKMAQYNLGVLYQKGGKGIPIDVGLGLCWLQKAAEGENGYLPARLAIALTWQRGVDGILPKNSERAREILKSVLEESRQKIEKLNSIKTSEGANSIDIGYSNPILELTSISSAALANFYLDICLNNILSGASHPLSISARYHLNYLSHSHSPAAAYNLGVLYDRHLNNLSLAVKCYKLAVHLGALNSAVGPNSPVGAVPVNNAEETQCVQNAMWNLGVIYAKGKGGLQKDLHAAKKWFDGVQVKDSEMRKVVKWRERRHNFDCLILANRIAFNILPIVFKFIYHGKRVCYHHKSESSLQVWSVSMSTLFHTSLLLPAS
ncbi:hypothetical protein G9A89_014846 [Geosiphon pyriformis]|nr:hypothetical protein G9A89_014846 [Geosiphon pyriformis]